MGEVSENLCHASKKVKFIGTNGSMLLCPEMQKPAYRIGKWQTGKFVMTLKSGFQ